MITNSASAAKATAKAILPHRNNATKFITAVQETKEGVDVSVNSQELASHVDDVFDGHAEGGKTILEGFEKVSENMDEGVVKDSMEAIGGAVEKVVGPAIDAVHDGVREVVKKGTEVVHGAARAIVTPKGMPDIPEPEEVAKGLSKTIKTQAEALPESAEKVFDAAEGIAQGVVDVVDPSGAMKAAIQNATEFVGESVVDLMEETVVEEAIETVIGSVPIVGTIMPSIHLLHGCVKTAAGVSSLAVGGAVYFVGGACGAVAAPFDGGATYGKVANVSREMSTWGASVTAEGGLIATKGAMGFADQIPGSQIATIPTKIACNIGAKSVNELRNSSRSVDVQGDDDFEGVVTEEMMQTGRTYEIFSTDGQRVLRASNTKSSRCFTLLGYAWGGYTLTFESTLQPPSSSVESQEQHEERQRRKGQKKQGQREQEQKEDEEQEDERREDEGQEEQEEQGDQGDQEEQGYQGDQGDQEGQADTSSSFSFSGGPGAYHLHSGLHGGNPLFFLGLCYPAEWVVWDVEGKMAGAWESLQLQWLEGGKKFTISGHGGQHVKWKDGLFWGTRSASKAAEFVLRERNSRSRTSITTTSTGTNTDTNATASTGTNTKSS
eukprot:g19359.t1